jgi:putative oxidoreductase
MPSNHPSHRLATTAVGFESYAYAALRIVAGALFMMHGTQKLFGWPGGGAHHLAVGSQMWIGGVIELVAGALIAIGLFARVAAFIASGEMAVAFFQFHWKFGDANWNPLVNKGELSVLYCFLFLFVWAHGAGVASLDGLRRRGARRH